MTTGISTHESNWIRSIPMVNVLDTSLEQLEGLDVRLSSGVGALRSLDPRRELATSMASIGMVCLRDQHDPVVVAAFTSSLCAIASALAENFPENIFWDLDFLARCLLRGVPRPERDPVCRIEQAGSLIVQLLKLFGSSTTIRFRYAHDFIYGFDWAKWVAKAPKERHSVGPFEPEFLEYMYRRAFELFTLIANDDTKYPTLRDQVHRNPFAFSREPEHEIILHQYLACDGLIPVEAWRYDTSPRWDLPYADLRVASATVLGLSTNLPTGRGGIETSGVGAT